MKKKAYRLEDSLGYKLFQASRLMTNTLNRHFKKHNFLLTHEQWQILSRLYEKDGQTQNELARLNEKDEPSVSRLIDNMIKRGLIDRKAHPQDKRINLIYLTEYSKRMEKDYTALAAQTIQEAAFGVDEKELAICLKVLDKVRVNLK
ncbi:MarR family transcriptional regulator [Bacillus aerolatus]|uniref:MarR family transcriptional regulator n=1 Tax=Bacillus aerolatus TaxID=2653354 RepID=A0A6I1FKM1_9BACI|nr:MarR family winged helix-turn-helix transcriptional regulator [Bacillus aerolatus]KAB7707212.1 MarR family transcriptional regulator [Bacillus aerolatus]